jgi:basic membrane protein A and related proteins
MKKWLLAVVACILVVTPLLSGCGGGDCDFRIGLVTDVGEIDDKSFNEAAWNGVVAAANEINVSEDCFGYIETQDAKDYEANMTAFIDEGAKAIVCPGFGSTQATEATARQFPDVYFIGVDHWYADPPANLVGVVFNEDQSGFLAGCLAALMTESGTVGGVYGTDVIPPVVYFREGYQNGAKYIDPNIKVLGAYHPGGLASGFTDPQWGHETAATMIDQGADVIFGAGGKTGNGGLEEAAERGLWCIGVDVDQYYTMPDFVKPYLLSSAMKAIKEGVIDQMVKAKNGRFVSGQVFGAATLAPYHDTDSKVPQDVKDRIAEITTGIQDGSISTGVQK